MTEHKPFESKSPELADFLAKMTPSGKDPRLGCCATCGKQIDPDRDFRDTLSLREWTISGMCQVCQDSIFGA